MRVISVPKDFPVSEVFAFLDIYTLQSRIIEDKIYLEISEFDYAIFRDYATKEGIDIGTIEL